MTLRELKNELVSLTALPLSQIEKGCVLAANRALIKIHTELKTATEKSIYVTKPCINSYTPQLLCCGGESLTLRLSGVCYSFRIFGTGSYTAIDGTQSFTQSFSEVGGVISGNIKSGEVNIKIEAKTKVVLLDVTAFDSFEPSTWGTVPSYDDLFKVRIDPDGRFLSLCGALTDKNGERIKGAVCSSDGVISYPESYEGIIKVKYLRLPEEIKGAYPDAKIDIPLSYSHLLAPLTAYELLANEDADAASALYNTYTELKRALCACLSLSEAEYTDTTRWA